MSELKEQVLAKVDLVELVGKTVKLEKSGRDFVGCCPFHGEKTPSFRVAVEKRKFHCFGCGEKGDAIDFRMKTGNLTFMEALNQLARENGIPIPETAGKGNANGNKGLLAELENAQKYYNWMLNNEDLGRDAREYLASRGISSEKANELGIGFAARPYWKKSKDLTSAEQAGLVRRFEDSGNYIDALSGRIIIPIDDESSRTIALSGRVAPWGPRADSVKYLNTHESPVFHKGSTFFRLNVPAIRQAGEAIVVEGQFDQISLDLAGAHNATATCGTALTADHIARLKKVTKRVLFLYDGDAAGQKAAHRGIELAIEGGLTPYVAILPDGEDPDSLVRTKGLAAIEGLERRDGFRWLLEGMIASHRAAADTAQAVVEEIAPVLAKYSDPVARDAKIGEVARELGVGEGAVRAKLGFDDPSVRMAAMEKALVYAAKISPDFRDILRRRDRIDDLFQGDALLTVQEMLVG